MTRKMTSISIVALLLLSAVACVALVGCGSTKTAPIELDEEETTTGEEKPAETSPESGEPESTSTGEQPAPESSELDKVVEVALSAARSNNPDLPELKVLEAKIVDDNYARVVVEPVDRSTDAATAYLKKVNGNWEVFDFGTGISPEMYPDAPPELFQ